MQIFVRPCQAQSLGMWRPLTRSWFHQFIKSGSVLPFGFCRQNCPSGFASPSQILLPTFWVLRRAQSPFSGEGLFFTGLLTASGVHRSGLPTWRCRGLLEQDPSSNWSTALSAAGLLPRGSNDRPTAGHEPFRGMRDGFCQEHLRSPCPTPKWRER